MKAVFAGNDAGLIAAVAFIDQLDADDTFWAAIAAHPKFDFASIDSAEIVKRLRGAPTPMRIVLWTPQGMIRKWKYRKTVALTDGNVPFVLNYHTKFLGNSVAEKVATIVHEFVHNVDNHDGDGGEQMGHGNNDWRGKQDSAPYWIGNEAETRYAGGAGGAKMLGAFAAMSDAPIPPAPCPHAEGEVLPGEIVSG